jgi:hypothetical protein
MGSTKENYGSNSKVEQELGKPFGRDGCGEVETNFGGCSVESSC